MHVSPETPVTGFHERGIKAPCQAGRPAGRTADRSFGRRLGLRRQEAGLDERLLMIIHLTGLDRAR